MSAIQKGELEAQRGEVKVEGVLLVFERKALRLVGAFGASRLEEWQEGGTRRGSGGADGLHKSKGGVDVEALKAGYLGAWSCRGRWVASKRGAGKKRDLRKKGS